MKLKQLAFVMAAVAVGVTGYYTTDLINNNDTQVEAHASWSYVADTADSLIEKAPLIAVANVKSIDQSSYFPYVEDDTTVFTDATLEIEEIIHSDENVQVGEQITLAQYGGKLKDGKILTYDDVPFLKKKQKVLVFLEKVSDDTIRSGKYQYFGGDLGLYFIEDKKKLNKPADNVNRISNDIETFGLDKVKMKSEMRNK